MERTGEMKQLKLHRVGVTENQMDIYVPEGTVVLAAHMTEERGSTYLDLETLEPQENKPHSLTIKLVDMPHGQVGDDFRYVATVNLVHVGRSHHFAVFVKEDSRI